MIAELPRKHKRRWFSPRLVKNQNLSVDLTVVCNYSYLKLNTSKHVLMNLTVNPGGECWLLILLWCLAYTGSRVWTRGIMYCILNVCVCVCAANISTLAWSASSSINSKIGLITREGKQRKFGNILIIRKEYWNVKLLRGEGMGFNIWFEHAWAERYLETIQCPNG